MTGQILDGAAFAEKIRAQVAEEVAQRAAQGRPVPGLATVLVGDNPASKAYVGSKQKACAAGWHPSFACLTCQPLPPRRRWKDWWRIERRQARQRHPGAAAAARRDWMKRAC